MKSIIPISLLSLTFLLSSIASFAQTEETVLKEELTAYDRSNSEYLLIEAQKFYLLENYKKSLAFLDQALEVDKDNHAAYFKIAEIALIESDHTKGLNAIDKAIALQKDNKYYYILGAELQKASQNLAGAAEYYDLMLANTKGINAYLLQITDVYESLNQIDKALEILEKIEPNSLNSEQKSKKVQLLIKANKQDQAIQYLAKLFKESPKNNELLYQYAYILSINEQVEEAISVLEKSTLNTNELTLLLAENYQRIGASDKQKQLILELHNDPEATLSMKTLLLGQWAFSSDLSTKANLIDSLQTQMNLDYPNEPLVIENGGLLYTKLAQSTTGQQRLIFEKMAIDYFRRLTKLRPGDFDVWNKILAHSYQQESWEALASTAEEALDLFPNQAVFYIYLASANQGLNKFKEAESLLNQASRMAMSNEFLKSQILGKQATLAIAMKEQEKAKLLFEQSIAFKQPHPESIASYADFLTANEPQKALNLIETVMDSPFKNLQFIRIKAQALFNLTKYSEADVLLTEGFNKFPIQQNGKSLELSGDILFKLDMINRAVEQWEAAKKLGGTSDKLDQKIDNRQYN